MTTTKRKKKKTTLTLSAENVAFIRNRVIPAKPEFDGAFTKALSAVIEDQLERLGKDEIPAIPPRECSGTKKQMVDATLHPFIIAQLDAIVDHWQGTAYRTSRSAVVDYLLTEFQEVVARYKAEL